jgi:hypothetical protein
MIVCCEFCVLLGRGLCDELITRPEESYRPGCVAECDLETSWMRKPRPTGGLSRQKQTSSQNCRPQWPRGLRRPYEAARLRRLWFRIPPGAWMIVCCECCVLLSRSLCFGLITRPEKSYWLSRVVDCDLETSWMRRPWPTGGLLLQKKKQFMKLIEIAMAEGSTYVNFKISHPLSVCYEFTATPPHRPALYGT